MKSYFKFLSRNKAYTAIEIFGLSVALAFVVILISYACMEYRVGKTQRQSKELYAVGGGESLGLTAGTAKAFFPSVPEIKEWTRFGEFRSMKGVVVDGKYFAPKMLAVDPNFLQFFDYKYIGGSRQQILTDNRQAIVSESFAKKAFGTVNPIGRTFRCDTIPFRVAGVIEDFGKVDVFSHHDIFVSMKLRDAVLQPMDNFGEIVTVARLAKGADPDKVAETLLDKYVDYWPRWYRRTKDDSTMMWGSSLVRLDKLYFSDVTNEMVFRHGNKKLVDTLLLVALILLLSAVFNYINLTAAQIGNRAKEMAMRRLMGESLMGIALRYLKESALFTAACFVLGSLVAFLLLPLFNVALGTRISLLATPAVLNCMICAYIVVTIVSGLFPAAAVIRFNPIDVVKGTVRLRSKMWFSKAFIMAQNVISMTLVVVSVTMMLQMRHLANIPLGYKTKDIIFIYSLLSPMYDQQAILVNQLKTLPEVEDATAGGGCPLECGSCGVHNEKGDAKSFLRLCQLDSVAMKMLGFRVIERYSEPMPHKLWISENTKRIYGVSSKHPWIGRNEKGGHEFEVCGVVENYYDGDALSVADENYHTAISVVSHGDLAYSILVKTRGNHDKALASIRKACADVVKKVTGVPMEMRAGYLDDILAHRLDEKRNLMILIVSFMFISVVISVLGMFAMSVYYSGQQRRQIALRKVMGASVADAAWQLSRYFLASSLVAVAVAVPICVRLMQFYLSEFAYRIDFPWWLLPTGALLTLFVALVSVISCTLRTALLNPIDCIKTE